MHILNPTNLTNWKITLSSGIENTCSFLIGYWGQDVHCETSTFQHFLLCSSPHALCVIYQKRQEAVVPETQGYGQNSELPEGWNHSKNNATEEEGPVPHPHADGLSSLFLSACMSCVQADSGSTMLCSLPMPWPQLTKHRSKTNTEDSKLSTRSTLQSKFRIRCS